MKDKFINTPEELYGWFQQRRWQIQDQGRGVNVGVGVRRDVMLSVGQGRIVIGAHVHQIKFDSKGGGVWRAWI